MKDGFDIAVHKFLFDRGITVDQFIQSLEKDRVGEANFKSPKIIYFLIKFYIKKIWAEYKGEQP